MSKKIDTAVFVQNLFVAIYLTIATKSTSLFLMFRIEFKLKQDVGNKLLCGSDKVNKFV